MRISLTTGITIAATAAVGMLLITSAANEYWSQLPRIAVAGAVTRGLFYLAALANPRAIGLGDVTLV